MTKKYLLGTSLLAVMLLLSGCGIKANEYGVSAKNVSELRQKQDLQIGVERFSATNPDEKHSSCRLQDTVTTPKGESFEEYITNALIEELQMAGVYNPQARLKLSGNIEQVYGSSMIGNAYWLIEATVTSSNGNSLSVSTKREYPSSYLASSACNNMASAFAPTVQELIHDIITHKEFNSLIR